MTPEEEFHSKLRAATADAETILDVGGGDGRMRCFYPPRALITAVDACEADLLKYPDPVRRVFRHAERALTEFFDAKSFDVVLGLDFVEHLPLDTAKLVITEMKRIAAHRVCLFVPEGEHPQTGTPENPYQAHLSTWNAPMLEALGFTVVLWREFHSVPGKSHGAMWATWERA